MSRILQILHLDPSPESRDYVDNKKQFHLFNLLTEQRHPKTRNLSFVLLSNIEAGLKMLLAVDEDITRKLGELSPSVLEQAVDAVTDAVRSGRKVFFYGCGATGRLAVQMESGLWRPFWNRLKQRKCWEKLQRALPAGIESAVIGDITGGDRALVSSLEGFEDLELVGSLQLQERKITVGDVVFCVTEGGETSSVIGAMQAALNQYGDLTPKRAEEARRHLYFVYNNPDDLLRPFHRSASVLDSDAISPINLTTGPQAITGSTRMQAATIETFVLGVILEEVLARVLGPHLDDEELRELGLGPASPAARLGDFARVKASVERAVSSIAKFTQLEAETYRNRRFTTYLAGSAINTVFVDSTERSPTFRLYPLDGVGDPPRCWVQVWTDAWDLRQAWDAFLGRPFRGLQPALYKNAFERVSDPYLSETALRSLTQAGTDQEFTYDFSFSAENVRRKGPGPGDLGVVVVLGGESARLSDSQSPFGRFAALFRARGAHTAAVSVAGPESGSDAASRQFDVFVPVLLEGVSDPLLLRHQIALKMLLNAHSTAVMARLGRVIGNTMTNVSPSNLKLVGRATFLIMSHVNDALIGSGLAHERDLVSFAEANAVLMDAMDYVRGRAMGQTAEVGLSIVRMIEALRRNANVSWEAARNILEREGLAAYLLRNNPALVT